MNFSIIRRCVRKENEFVLNVDLNKLKNGYLTLRRECNLTKNVRHRIDFTKKKKLFFQNSVSTNATIAGKLQGLAAKEERSISSIINLILEDYFK